MAKRQTTLKQLITRSRGQSDAEEFDQYKLDTLAPLGESANMMMTIVPPSFGACVMLSSSWVAYLRDRYSIPAIAVAGDLKVSGKRIFKYKEKLPVPTKGNRVIQKSWSGHCWVEVDGYICDLSIFRTAYAASHPSILKEYILSNFGPGKGALISLSTDLPVGMQYTPKYVLTESQIDMFVNSLRYQIEHGI